jgi:hypothetical protein
MIRNDVAAARKSWSPPKLQRLHVQGAEGKGTLTNDNGGKSGS